jgi:aspartate racemase
VHQAFDLVEHRSPRPWLHIAVEVANEANSQGYKRLGVLGTRALMEGPVYREKLKAAGIDHRIPGPEQRERIHRIIFGELVQGVFLPRTQAYLTEVSSLQVSTDCTPRTGALVERLRSFPLCSSSSS